MSEYRKIPIVVGDDGNLEEISADDSLCFASERLGNSTVYVERKYTLSTHTIQPETEAVEIGSLSFLASEYSGLKTNYILKRGTSSVRMGTILVACNDNDATISFYDTEIGHCGVEFTVSNVDGTVKIFWESDNTANDATARFETTLYKL